MLDTKELDLFIDALDSKNGALITTLHKAQNIYGYLPEEIQRHVAKRLNVPVSKVFGVVTFYSLFTMQPKGKYEIRVCMGTACFVRGAQDVLEEFKSQLGIEVGQMTQDKLFSLDAIRCVGACGLAPVISINGKIYGNMTKEKVKEVLDEIKQNQKMDSAVTADMYSLG